MMHRGTSQTDQSPSEDVGTGFVAPNETVIGEGRSQSVGRGPRQSSVFLQFEQGKGPCRVEGAQNRHGLVEYSDPR